MEGTDGLRACEDRPAHALRMIPPSSIPACVLLLPTHDRGHEPTSESLGQIGEEATRPEDRTGLVKTLLAGILN